MRQVNNQIINYSAFECCSKNENCGCGKADKNLRIYEGGFWGHNHLCIILIGSFSYCNPISIVMGTVPESKICITCKDKI